MDSTSSGRIIVFGATGYTGRLTADVLVRDGVHPVLAGRDQDALKQMAEELDRNYPGRPEPRIQLADVADQASVDALVNSPRDVLISTVGPFSELGEAAALAATRAGCGYLDSTGEPMFIRRVFEDFGPQAEHTGARLLPAFGYDYIPGQLAATIAIRRSLTGGRPPSRVDIGYYSFGKVRSSAGTRASMSRVVLEPSFAWRGGEIEHERPGAKTRSFDLGADRHWDGFSIGGVEHFTLPAFAPTLTDVNIFVGSAGRLTRAAQLAGALTSTASRVPGVASALGALVKNAAGPSNGTGPTEAERAVARSVGVAETYDPAGDLQQRVLVEGPSPYDLTAHLLSWGAMMLAHSGENLAGAMGPVQAFGTQGFISGCLALGLAETRAL